MTTILEWLEGILRRALDKLAFALSVYSDIQRLPHTPEVTYT